MDTASHANGPQGNIYIITAPSGAGKTTLSRALLDAVDNLQLAISHTTRKKRAAEVSGVHYHFVDVAQFKNMQQAHTFMECAKVHGNYYGTSLKPVKETLASGMDVLLEIDWQGAQQVRKFFPDALSIFILPPSQAVLRARLQTRKQDTAAVIDTRIRAAAEETQHCEDCDYLVINDTFEQALHELQAIVMAHRLRCATQIIKHRKKIAAWRDMC